MTRIRKYFTRVLNHMGDENCPAALSDAAELQYQTGALYKEIEKFYLEHRNGSPETYRNLPRKRD